MLGSKNGLMWIRTRYNNNVRHMYKYHTHHTSEASPHNTSATSATNDVYYTWFGIPGTWYFVPGTWYLVHSTRYIPPQKSFSLCASYAVRTHTYTKESTYIRRHRKLLFSAQHSTVEICNAVYIFVYIYTSTMMYYNNIKQCSKSE